MRLWPADCPSSPPSNRDRLSRMRLRAISLLQLKWTNWPNESGIYMIVLTFEREWVRRPVKRPKVTLGKSTELIWFLFMKRFSKRGFFGLTALVILLLLVGVLSRGSVLNGGIILGEPDEFVHVKLVESILQNGQPTFQGKGFYYELPGYFTLGSLVTRIFSFAPLVSLRLISLVSTLGTAGLVFFYLKRKESWLEATTGGLFYLLIPLSVFYSRVGIIEPLLVFLLTGTMVFFDLGRVEKNWRFSAFAGLFLGLGLLTKYSILPIFVLVVGFFLLDFFQDNLRFWKSDSIRLRLIGFLPIVLSLVLFLPVLLYFYKLDSLTLKDQTRQVFGLTGETKQELRLERLVDFSWWFSIPLVFLAVVGFVVRLKSIRREGFMAISFLLMVATIVSRFTISSHYLIFKE